ncbi:MAG: WD40/YVTN/BNR-like repeat-containing protein [Halomonadaceae bacterium]
MSRVDQLDAYRRPEVKAAVQQGSDIWLGSAAGLYRLRDAKLEAIPEWQGLRISVLAASEAGLLVGASGAEGQVLARTDVDGGLQQRLPSLPRDEAKALLCSEGATVAGGKRGLYRLEADGWRHCYGQGHTEIIGLAAERGRLLAFCKKQGSKARPALLVSTDHGESWTLELETGYHDGILAAWKVGYLTRWRGLWRTGSPIRHQKRPFSAAGESEAARAWVVGNKLVCEFANGTSVELEEPRFAEAEQLILMPEGRALVAGITGAFLVELGGGRVHDVFAGHAVPPSAAKIKRLWSLDEGRILATATFGTFYSDDGGGHWQPAAAEWAALDAEGLACSADGAWYMATQRGLFSSWDNGASWRHVKLTPQPHFAELTDLAFIGDRLALGSKAGLFLSAADRPKELTWIEAVGDATVHALLAEGSGLWVGMVDGRLLLVDSSTGRGEVKAMFQAPCQPLLATGKTLWVLSGGQLFEVTARSVNPIAHPDGAERLKEAFASGRGLLVWDQANGWVLEEATEAPRWAALEAWLPAVKSVTGMAPRLITDRCVILALP